MSLTLLQIHLNELVNLKTFTLMTYGLLNNPPPNKPAPKTAAPVVV